MPVGNVGDAHRRIGRVDVLAARARGAVGVDAAVAFVDLDVDLVVDHRIDPDRGEAGVAARVRIERRDAHQAMHAGFGLRPSRSALWPLISSVADLMPASSPGVSSISSTLNLWRSAQRAYMRSSMRAQSWLSVPPAPE